MSYFHFDRNYLADDSASNDCRTCLLDIVVVLIVAVDDSRPTMEGT